MITTIIKPAVTEASDALVVLLQEVKENRVNIKRYMFFILRNNHSNIIFIHQMFVIKLLIH